MSHPMYNPFTAGKQMPPQGPYGHSSGQMERDPRRPPPHLGPGSNFGSSGSPAVSHGPSGGPIPSLLSLPVNYRPERSKVPVDEDMDQCLNLNISRAREDAMQNSASQNTQTTNFNEFPNVQADTFPSSNTGMTSYLMPLAAQVNRPFTVDRGSTSLDWAPVEESSKMYPSASSSFLGSGDSGIQAFVGLGNYDTSMSDKSTLPREAIHPNYTSESASNILLHFGLQKDDLDHLTSFPEHQITPENLPFILRQIRLEKAKRSSTSVQSTPYDEAQPMRSMGELDKLITSRGPVLDPGQKTSTVVTQSKVIDYGHTSKSELSSFGPLNKDTDLRQLVSEVPNTLPSKKPAPAHQAASKTQPSKPPSNLIRGAHPGRPGLVLIGSNAQSHSNDQTRSSGQASKASKPRMQNKAKGGQKQPLQMLHQRPPQPKVFPATKPAPLLLIPCRPPPSTRGPGQMDAVTRLGPSKHLPSPSLMEDYAAATPSIFPHTCSLCMKQCTSAKDWLSHQNTGLHLENCRLLRGRYPEWDGRTQEFLSASGLDSQPAPATAGHNLLNRHQKSIHENASRSLSPRRQRGSEDRKEKLDRRDRRFSPSRSHSPHHYHASESRRERRSSRSRSPQTSRYTQRPRSHSYDRPTSSYHRSRSRSYERLSSPRRREAKWPSPRRSYERRLSPRSDERCFSPRRSHERRSSGERSVLQHKRSRSADRLAKRLLEKKAVQSLSKQSDLEAMVKTLAPVLLAELANLKSSSSAASSLSSSKTEKKTSSHKSSKALSSRPRSGTSSSTKTASGRSTSPCVVNLSGVFSSLSHTDMVEAMEKFGKVKSVVLFRSTLKARVVFEKSEDAKKLQRLKRCHVKGLPVSIDRPVGTALKNSLQKSAPEKKSGASKSQTTKSHTTVKIKKPLSSETRNTTKGNLVSKAKVLVSKAKSISTKQVAKTVKKSSANGKSAGKSAGGRREASVVPKSKTAGNRPPADKTKKTVTNTKPVRDGGKSAPNKTSKVRQQSNKSVKGKTSTSKPKTTVKAEERSVKASSEKHPSTVSHSESSAEHRKTKTDTGEKLKQSPKMTNTQQGSAQMESVSSSMSPSDCSNKEELPKPQTSSSVSKTPANIPAGSSTRTSVSGSGENAAKLSHLDDNIFKVLTTEINKHRPTKGAMCENKDKESTTVSKTPPEDAKQKNTQHTKDKNKGESYASGRFDELDFSSGDFVTVDEINEDMEDTAVEDQPSSSKPTSKETKDRQSSAARKTSTRSASSSSKPSKDGLSSCSTSSPSDKRKSFPEPKKSKTKTSSAKDTKSSHSSSFSKSVETPPSSGQKVQSNKSKAPVRSLKPSYSGRSTRSSATATKSSVKTQQEHKKDVKPSEGAMAKSDHKVSAEGCAAKTAGDEIVKEMKKNKAKEKIKDTDGKSTEEKRGNNENKQILDSLNEKSDEQKNKEDSQDRRPEIQIPAPEQDQTIHQGGLPVVESADDDNARSDECQEMEADESTELQDGAPKDQAATGDGDGDEGTTMMQVSEKDETKEVQSSEGSSVRGTADRNQVTSEETNQTPNTCVVAVNVKQKDETLLSEDVCETSKEIGQTSKEEDHDDSKDTLKDQKLVVPTDLLSKADNEPTDEEVYEVIDSLEDGPTTTETESETEKKEQRKKESKTASRDVRPTRQGRSRSRTSKSEEKEKSPKQLDKAKYATQMKDSKTEKECLENFEEMVYEVVDSIEDDSVQETSTTGSSSRRRTARGNKKDEKTSPSVEEPTRSDKEEEEMFTVLDSVEEESPHDKPVVMRSTRGRRENTVKNVEENTKMKEDKTPTRRRHIPVRDSKEKGGAKTSKTDVLLKESAPTKKSAAAVTSTGEEDGTHEELDAVEDDQPTTQKTRRGRPKKDNKTSKKQTEEEPVYQIVDSLEEDQEETMTVASSLQKESETKAEMVPNVNTGLLTKMKGDKTPTRGIHTPARDSQEKDRIPLKESTPTKKSAAAVSSTVEEDGTSEKLDAVVDDQPTTQKPRRRHPPARDSQEKDRVKTPKTDVCVPLKERTPTNKSDARHLGEDETTYEVLDAVEEDLVKPTTQTSRRGRPKKDNKASKKQTDLKKVDSPRKVEEEEAAYQILDSVEDEVVDDRAPIDQSESASALGTSADDDIAKEIIRSLLNEEEGEMLYQIVDSLEEDQVQEETMTETSMQKESETTEDTVAGTDHILSSPSTAELSEQTDGGDKTLPRLAGKPLVDKEDPSAKGSDTEKKGSTSKADVGREDESLNKPNSHLGASEKNMLKSPKRKGTKATKNVLVNLDQVSEEEEDYPDDAAEEELLKKRQAAAKKRENDRGERKSRERKTREQRSQSSSRGESEKLTSETEKTTQEDLEKVEVDTQDLVTLDEVGEDEVEEEAVTEAPAWDGELTEGELQDLVTLDEIIEEEEGKIEAPPQSQESQIVDFLKLETLSALTETAWIEDKKDDDPKEPSSLPKRKHDDTTEESGNFVTVDELGEIEEEEGKEAVTTRSRPRKRSRQTPVRKSTRGKTVKEEPYGREEGDKSLPPASLDSSSTLDTSGATGDVQLESERMEEEKNTGAASAEHQPLPNDGLKLGSEEAEKQMHSRAVVKVIDKRKQELMGPDAKRFRSQSPSVPVALQLPPFNPKNPLGKEFVNPTSGFFCSLCSVFYRNEDTAKEIHCSSREHYDNLKNHYQRLHQGVQSSLTD